MLFVALFEDKIEPINGHGLGEGELNFTLLPAGSLLHLRGSDESPIANGGLVVWDHFLERCGLIGKVAEQMIH